MFLFVSFGLVLGSLLVMLRVYSFYSLFSRLSPGGTQSIIWGAVANALQGKCLSGYNITLASL